MGVWDDSSSPLQLILGADVSSCFTATLQDCKAMCEANADCWRISWRSDADLAEGFGPCCLKSAVGGSLTTSAGARTCVLVRRTPLLGDFARFPPRTISTIAGSGSSEFSEGSATFSGLYYPTGVTTTTNGQSAAAAAPLSIFVADLGHNRIRKITPSGEMSTVAGTGAFSEGGDGGPATSASLQSPNSVAVDKEGNVYIANRDGNRVRKVLAADGTITTLAEMGYPWALNFDPGGDNLLVAQLSDRVVRVALASGDVTPVAGTGTRGFSGDGGVATQSLLNMATGVAQDVGGNIYVVDQGNSRLRKVTPDGTLVTVAGNGAAGDRGDGEPAMYANLYEPVNVDVDGAGNVFIADAGNNRIRVVWAATGIIETLAGNGIASWSGDGGPAASASLNRPWGVHVDRDGNVLVADTYNNRIRVIWRAGVPFSSSSSSSSATPIPSPTPSPTWTPEAESPSPSPSAPSSSSSPVALLRLGKGTACAIDEECLSDVCLGGCCCSPVAASDPDCVACRCGVGAGGCSKRIPSSDDVCGDTEGGALPFNLRVLSASSPLNSRGEDLIIIPSRFCGDAEGTPFECPDGGGGGGGDGGGDDSTAAPMETAAVDVDGARYYVVGAAGALQMRAVTCDDEGESGVPTTPSTTPPAAAFAPAAAAAAIAIAAAVPSVSMDPRRREFSAGETRTGDDDASSPGTFSAVPLAAVALAAVGGALATAFVQALISRWRRRAVASRAHGSGGWKSGLPILVKLNPGTFAVEATQAPASPEGGEGGGGGGGSSVAGPQQG
jgi:sugar lactone lactonase YvrE